MKHYVYLVLRVGPEWRDVIMCKTTDADATAVCARRNEQASKSKNDLERMSVYQVQRIEVTE